MLELLRTPGAPFSFSPTHWPISPSHHPISGQQYGQPYPVFIDYISVSECLCPYQHAVSRLPIVLFLSVDTSHEIIPGPNESIIHKTYCTVTSNFQGAKGHPSPAVQGFQESPGPPRPRVALRGRWAWNGIDGQMASNGVERRSQDGPIIPLEWRDGNVAPLPPVHVLSNAYILVPIHLGYLNRESADNNRPCRRIRFRPYHRFRAVLSVCQESRVRSL